MVKKRELRVMICMMTACLAAMAHHHQQLLILSASRMDEDEAVGNDDQEEEDVHDDDREEPKKKRTRCSYGRPDYNSSEWAVMLKKAHLLADPTTEEAKSFRTSFRVPYPFFLDLVENVKAGEWEGFMANTTGVGRLNYICVELKVLAVLYVLGKGNSFDDVSQMSRLSVPTVQRIFHAFMERYATDLYATTVVKPTGQALADTMKDFDAAGFPGAVGSTAVTHLHWQHAPYSGRQSYLGREGLPTLAYECTVDRSGRCLAATKGMPGAQSDSAIACSDEFVKEVRDGDYKDMEFTLKGENGEDVKEKGLWLLAGGEHHLWRCLQCPMKVPASQAELTYKSHHESVHKDAERFFEDLKGRFRILKAPCLYKKSDCIDNVFLTCCVLHNMLHDFDGIELLEAGVDWKGADGSLDPPEDVGEGVILPTARPAAAPVQIEVENGFHSLRQKLVANVMFRKHQGTLDEPA